MRIIAVITEDEAAAATAAAAAEVRDVAIKSGGLCWIPRTGKVSDRTKASIGGRLVTYGTLEGKWLSINC